MKTEIQGYPVRIMNQGTPVGLFLVLLFIAAELFGCVAELTSIAASLAKIAGK